MKSAAAFVWSPVRFFRVRLESDPHWGWALAAPLACGLLDMAGVVTMGSRNMAAAGAVLASIDPGAVAAARIASLLAVVGYPIYFALMALIAASVDVLFGTSDRPLRLVEFTGLAFFAFLPVCLFTLVVSLLWTPPLNPPGASFLSLEATVVDFAAAMQADPWLSTARIVYLFSLAWCAALVGAALEATSGFRTPAAGATAMLLFLAFSGFWR